MSTYPDAWSAEYASKRPKSLELYARAKAAIGGGVGHDVRFNPIVPVYIERAAGSRKWDIDGNEYIDYNLGNGSLLLGHSDPGAIQAIQDVVERGLHYGNDHPRMIEWAELIQSMVPSAERVRFDNSGTEGSMLVIRLARAFTGKTKILRFEGHFSGWHDYVGKGAYPPFDQPVSMGIPQATLDTIVVIPADLEVVDRTLAEDGDIAALMLEPSGASWGTIPLTRDFNRELEQIVRKHGVLLIYDEVITGFRYGPAGYQGWAGTRPDLTVFGKIVTGGMPGGAICGRADILGQFDFTGDPQHDRFGRVQHLGTFNASPLTTASAISTLQRVADGQPQARASKVGAQIRAELDEICERLDAAAYVYGEESIFHLYMRAAGGEPVRSREELVTTDAATLKGIPGGVISAFQRNLQIRGVDLMSYNGGVTSATHTDKDVQATVRAFEETLRVLLDEGIVARIAR
jgi:glutamate-1-semialdehyde 2,1-aminomutase